MSKSVIKVIIENKKIVRNINLDTKLDEFRLSLKNNMPETSFFLMDDATIEKENENEFSIKDILKGKEVYCYMNTNNINRYLNDKIICELNAGIEETIEYLLKELKNKIPKESKIKYEDIEVGLDEAIEQ